MNIAGIDPGISGAIVVINEQQRIIGIHDMPIIHEIMTSGKTTKRVDVLTLAAMLKLYHLDRIIIEHVSARPGQGAVSTFSFGHSYGSISAVAALTGATVSTVRPSTWKKVMGLTADKDEARERAVEVSGDSESFKLKRHHDRAEAYLLAIYANQLDRACDRTNIIRK